MLTINNVQTECMFSTVLDDKIQKDNLKEDKKYEKIGGAIR